MVQKAVLWMRKGLNNLLKLVGKSLKVKKQHLGENNLRQRTNFNPWFWILVVFLRMFVLT